MKTQNKFFALLALLSIPMTLIEAKSIEFILNERTEIVYHLNENIPEISQDQPFTQSPPKHYCQKLTIKNSGNHPLLNCFPYVNESKNFTVSSLINRLVSEYHPLQTLGHFWKKHVIIVDDSIKQDFAHPLDIINFSGLCSRKDYIKKFIDLCASLGIDARKVNAYQLKLYDFEVDDETWHLLDLENNGIYFSLNNETLVSSDDILDDPFLAMRNKHSRAANGIDFLKNWKKLAALDFIDSNYNEPLSYSISKLTNRPVGFDLYPGETFIFETPEIRKDLHPYACAIEHAINLEARGVSHHFKYRSPVPIRNIKNQTKGILFLSDQKIQLQPGEQVEFKSPTFKIKMTFSNPSAGQVIVSGKGAWTIFPSLVKGKNLIALGSDNNATNINLTYEVNEEFEKTAQIPIEVANISNRFQYIAPNFELKTLPNIEKIWWQVSIDENFNLIPSTLDQVEPFTSIVTLSTIAETFLNPDSRYYFRVKAFSNGQWGEWSKPFSFSVEKPHHVDPVSFCPINNFMYELDWERNAGGLDETIEYLIFGSNSLDFVPSIYYDKQINAILAEEATEEEQNNNLIAITREPKIQINGELAYYRIIARQHGQLSVPSKIIRVYDKDLVQPRNVLQVDKENSEFSAKRILFPLNFSCSHRALPELSIKAFNKTFIIKLQTLLRSVREINLTHFDYQLPDCPEEVWAAVKPHLLPDNHPAWAKLNRVFCRKRATQSPEHFKKAGFRRWQPGRWSRVCASAHPNFPEYFIKAYCDSETGIIYDWKKWLHRIRGAETVRECIIRNQLQDNFKVPKKYIYPMPLKPSPPKRGRYVRKNFILVCENMNIIENKTNEKLYRTKMTKELLKGLYIILQECGLYDSVYHFNIPFCKDGKLAVIDTEYHHKWPIPFFKLDNRFPKNVQSYWKKITFKGGKIPDGENEWNPPRMERRDNLDKNWKVKLIKKK